jgi:hypothetical protein
MICINFVDPVLNRLIQAKTSWVYTGNSLSRMIVIYPKQNLQLISSFQKLPPVKVNKLFHCVKSCYRRDLIFIQ